MDPLKEMFNETYYTKLTKAVHSIFPALDQSKFFNDMMDGISDRELNDRMHHTAKTLGKYLPAEYKKAINLLDKVILQMNTGYTALVFPDFVSMFGKNHIDISLQALKRYTVYGSSEFAIREFLKLDFEKTLRTLYTWAEDKNHHVRRLASEGSRPRLPWSFKLDAVIENPKHTAPILNKLNTDPELYVRKSVANHINDVSKDHPEYVIKMLNSWDKSHEHTGWIIKHACRTLIKKGDVGALKLFDAHKQASIQINDFIVSPNKIKLGDTLEIKFDFASASNLNQKLIMDYIIHYVKKEGGTSAKVFKWKELNLLPGEKMILSKKQRIVDFTTRVHYKGYHKVEVQVNGKVVGTSGFELKIG